ncbi:hypothetical protein HDU81_005817 [Chytriomyces hyalinus]|nr:hypothetical protein HDU81_005817 [Chytriomyces hyalinus]
MKTNSIVSIVLAFIALTAEVSATYGAPQIKLPTTYNNAYKVNAQVPATYKDTKSTNPTYKEVKPVKAYQPAKPVNVYKESKPVNAYKEAKPSYKDVKPVQAYKDARPAKPYKGTTPAKLNNGDYVDNGSGNQVVPVPVVPAYNQKPQDNTVPAVQVDPVPAITNDVAPPVDASTVAVEPAVVDAVAVQPAATQPDFAPVTPVSDTSAGTEFGPAVYKLRR